eukprot:CAMPEP_0197575096 /NCGR_PEP_ID=MMETSP1326-20131121/609_1 /TAXON_ID=1155430 /ORGANISM="Genus nov. species nov., Strain RCC2288" /LENGTH=759 /DNA_ID=CAMNT_0043137801 /DNA_START=154 /DNA_END=2433 /DNA_ORIENTATION=+
MKLKIQKQGSAIHSDLVSAVGWNVFNELYSCSDDKTVCRWDMSGDAGGKVMDLDTFVTDMQWSPGANKSNAAGNDVFVVSCTDGTFKIVGRNGRVEKSVEAHRGAVISLRWNSDGTALVTVGEDGALKVWSRNGMLRSVLEQRDVPMYCVSWAPDGDQVLFGSGKELFIKPLNPGSKTLKWKAHDGVVLRCDWSALNSTIVSGGEDCRYKVWDCYGRLLYQSAAYDYAITSVAWNPSGDIFAVGSFNALFLCDKTGWTCSKAKLETGSVYNIAWTADGTQLAGSGGNGSVCFGSILDHTLEWDKIAATLEEGTRIRVRDVMSESVEDLDFRDRVIKMSLGFGYLVVVTATQVCVYKETNWATPHMFDIKDVVTLVVQCRTCFLLVNSAGCQLFSYEGRQVCAPKSPGLRPEMLNAQSVALSPDTLAIIDRSTSKTVRFLDTSAGKPVGEEMTHSMEVTDVCLSQTGSTPDRKLVFIDRNRDLYITPVLKAATYKLGTMVDSCRWNDTTDMLAAMVDQRLVVWYYPNVVYVDKDLTALTKFVKDGGFGKVPQLTYFNGARCTVRRIDGARIAASASPHIPLLYEHMLSNQWDKAIRMCRFVKDNSLWACLAAMSVAAKDLNTAEIAYAAIEEVDKVQFINTIKNIPTEEGRSAELCLFRRRPEEAEAILLQAGLVFRAIETNIKLFNWDRALELAVQHKTHVDTVIYYRNIYLEQSQRAESNQRFLQYAQSVTVDEQAVLTKVEQEKEKEASRPGARRYK